MKRGKQISCAYCDKQNLSKDEIGLNKRLIHQQIERMKCMTCMAAHFETTEEELNGMIEGFKRQGCSLFG